MNREYKIRQKHFKKKRIQKSKTDFLLKQQLQNYVNYEKIFLNPQIHQLHN